MMSSLLCLSWLQGTEISCASFSLEASLIPGTAAASRQSHKNQNWQDLRCPPTPALNPRSCRVPAHHDSRQASPGLYRTDEVGGGRSDGAGLLGHMHRGEDRMYGRLPIPAALHQKAPLSDFPAQPLFAEAGHPLFFCVCLSDFSKREEKVEFSSASPRESEHSGQKRPCEANKENNLVSSSWV